MNEKRMKRVAREIAAFIREECIIGHPDMSPATMAIRAKTELLAEASTILANWSTWDTLIGDIVAKIQVAE